VNNKQELYVFPFGLRTPHRRSHQRSQLDRRVPTTSPVYSIRHGKVINGVTESPPCIFWGLPYLLSISPLSHCIKFPQLWGFTCSALIQQPSHFSSEALQIICPLRRIFSCPNRLRGQLSSYAEIRVSWTERTASLNLASFVMFIAGPQSPSRKESQLVPHFGP